MNFEYIIEAFTEEKEAKKIGWIQDAYVLQQRQEEKTI